YNAFAYDSGLPTKLPLSNNYNYVQNIEAAYITFSQKQKNFSYQLGLRAEYSKFDGLLVDSAYKFGYEYPDKIGNIWNALFPSLFVTQKINDKDELQFNYTRRINRPDFWEMNPFIDISDPANLRQGNPQLKPEFINSFEFNYSKNYSNGNFLGVLYFVNNPRDITQYSDTISAHQYQQLNNAGISPNAILNTYINANTTNRYGAEFTLQHTLSKNFDVTPSLNLQYRTIKADVNNISLSNQGFNWGGKLMANYKTDITNSPLWSNIGLQLSGQYHSPRVIPQGKQLARYNLDFAVRKDFLKDKKANITFAVNDILNSQKWGNVYNTDQFYQYSYSRWNVRTFRLTFSYKFGDPNFSISKKQNNKQNSPDVSNEN
ncbi:MAG: TonB-dependent receptor family protein, partial [Bacteroidetes bacterium]|nr:TonB-dependent receptor family protein [Bacteroidota bacterium]